MTHSPEPWGERELPPECEFDGYFRIIDADGRRVATVPTSSAQTGLLRTVYGKAVGAGRENTARIVACVNACKGIPTGVLHVFVGRMKEALRLASEITPLNRQIEEQRLREYLDLSLRILNDAGMHWEKNT